MKFNFLALLFGVCLVVCAGCGGGDSDPVVPENPEPPPADLDPAGMTAPPAKPLK